MEVEVVEVLEVEVEVVEVVEVEVVMEVEVVVHDRMLFVWAGRPGNSLT